MHALVHHPGAAVGAGHQLEQTQLLATLRAGQPLDRERDRPHMVLRGVRGADALEVQPLVVVRVAAREHRGAGGQVQRIILRHAAQVRQGEQARHVRVVQEPVVAAPVDLIGPDPFARRPLDRAVLHQRRTDLLRPLPRLVRLRRGIRDLLQQLRETLQGEGEEVVAGDVVAQLTGVVRGAESRPHQAVRRGQGAAPLPGEGVLGGHAGASEEVRGALLVVLLGPDGGEDRAGRGQEVLVGPGGVAGRPPQPPGEVRAVGEGVELELALPRPGILALGLVRVPVGGVRGTVEGVGVRVDLEVLPVAAQQPGEQRDQLGTVLVGPHPGDHEPQQRRQLRGGVPQPHRRDVAGDHEGGAVLLHTHRGLGGVAQVRDHALRDLADQRVGGAEVGEALEHACLHGVEEGVGKPGHGSPHREWVGIASVSRSLAPGPAVRGACSDPHHLGAVAALRPRELE